MRTRLGAVLEERWTRRVTAVVAGAGFGKSHLVHQALVANHQARRGVDAWVGCQHEDAGMERLFDAVFTAVRGTPSLDLPADLDDAVHRIADAVWSHAPLPVTLVLDDVHLLGEGTPGSSLLDALVRRLPANAHFLVTSRSRAGLPASTARLRTTGDATVLTEADLAMTSEELEAFARHRGRGELDLTRTGGWPALAELAVHTGEVTAPELAEYLTDELLGDLAASQVGALAVLAGVGPLAPEDLVSIVGADLDPAELTALPLVETTGDLIEVHALWDVARRVVDPRWLGVATAAAARVLSTRGSHERAFRVAAAAGDRRLSLELLGELCRSSIHSRGDVDLRSCVAALEPGDRAEPEALVASALADVHVGWECQRDLLISTAEMLADAGAEQLELVVLARLGILAWQAGDLSVADHLLPRIDRMIDSDAPETAAFVVLGGALMAEVLGDHGTMWERVEEFERLEVPEPLHTIGHRYRASLDLLYGDPRDALGRVTTLEATTPPSLRVDLQALALWSAWACGDVATANRWADRIRAGSERVDDPVVAANLELFEAWSPTRAPEHSTEAAGRPPAVAASIRAREGGWLVPSLVFALAAATRSVVDGDEGAAAAVLEEAFGTPATHGVRARSAAIRGLAVVWVLLPAWRHELETLGLGEGPSSALAAARALCAAREAAPGDETWRQDAREVLSDPGLPTRLPAPWVAELAVRFVGSEQTDERLVVAQDAVDGLGPLAAPTLRRLAASTSEAGVTAGAKAILARRTPVSEGRFTLRLLGPAAIEHDGVVVDHPDWRRDRVRGLFALIARRGSVSRREAADVLWPDLDPDAGANNLRVTLSYLQRVLEPDRTRHEIAYHVRADGASLRFAGRSSWAVDVEEFEQLLDGAEQADRRGGSAEALEGYLSAVSWYGGSFLSDVEVGVAEELERERLCSRYVRALVRAGSLLLAVGRVEEAQRFAVAAQAADPWSDTAICLQTEAFLAAGDRSAALRTHRRAVELVADLGLGPSPDLERLGRSLAS